MTAFYDTQRAMRRVREAAMQRGTVALLDVGTSKIVCLILAFDGAAEGAPVAANDHGVGALAGQSAFRIVGCATTRARGMAAGEIAHARETESAIRTVLRSAQDSAGVRVDHAIVCLSGGRVRSHALEGTTDVGGAEVEGGDVSLALADCAPQGADPFGPARDVLHAHPVAYALDHRANLADPRGQVGHALSTVVHALSVDGAAMRTLATSVARCDLELAGVASAAYASGLSALVENEQELGAACVDLGGGASSIAVFCRGHMVHADTVRIGGDHVTSDISMGLRVPTSVAERIKTFYGGAVATGQDDREMIEISGDTGDWERDRRQVSRAELIGIMRPRIEEILEEVRLKLEAAGFDDMPSRQIVLTGGGSQTPGIDTLAMRILGSQVRFGRPMRVPGLPQAAAGPAFASAVGLAMHAADPRDECWDFAAPDPYLHARGLKRAIGWFRSNW
ncbi:MAG: cell division protein FtsA [Paracoccaceae bacterium]